MAMAANEECRGVGMRGVAVGGSNGFGVCCATHPTLADRYFDEQGLTDVPLVVSGTLVDQSGRTLSGQTTEVRQEGGPASVTWLMWADQASRRPHD